MKPEKRKSRFLLYAVLTLVFSVIFAFPVTADAAAKKITLNAAKQTVYVGKTGTVSVKSVQGLASKKVTFTSSKPQVATVTKKGKVKGISAGKTVITVTSKTNKKVKAVCKVTVKQPVKTIQTASKLTLQKGKRVTLAYSVAPQTAANKKVTFKSSNSAVASVTSKGVIKAKKAGSAKITVASKDGQAKATVTVKVANKLTAVKSVALDAADARLTVGEKKTLKASVTPSNATVKTVYWVSSNPDVATVSKKGVVTAKAAGTAKVTAYAADSSKKKAVCTVTVEEKQPAAAAEAALSVESALYGTAYTNGKSTLKHDLGIEVDYDEASRAVLTLALPDGSSVDDSKIDSSKAVVKLVEGDGYYPSEYKFLATSLQGTWKNGTLEYRLSKGDLDIDYGVYPNIDSNSGREWSCLGGDGHGNYLFNLEVSGILYDGKPVASQTFPVHIYVYGYNYTSDAVGLYTENGTPAITAEFASLESKAGSAPAAGTAPVWTWVGDGEKPILCDNLADDFYITWPTATDASALKDSDVSIRLYNARGSEKVLTAGKDFAVHSSKGETQIAVLYQNWAFIPVYTTMSIEVNGTAAKAQNTFDIASVYVYEAQQGGGGTTIDGTVTAYSFYGLANLTDWKQLFSPAIYLLSYNEDGTTWYYAEDASGVGSLTGNIQEAKQFDASGEEDKNLKLIGNTIYITTRQVMRKIVKTVDGQSITFTQSYPGRNAGISAGGSLLNPKSCDQKLEAAPGYVIPWGTSNWITNEKWAWQKGVEEGWTGIDVTPYSGKYEWSVVAGTSQQFEAALGGKAVTGEWRIYGKVKEGTTVTQDGLVTVAADETAAQFAVAITSADGTKGTVTVKVTQPTVKLAVDSALYGTVYTSGKSTLKHDLGIEVDYDAASKAVLTVAMSNGRSVDDSKIDSSKAVVKLVEGDGYYPSEYKFLATSLEGTWKDGSLEYTLSKGDLDIDYDVYPNIDSNSGREWSCLGGDGQGNYLFNLEVSGILYDGKPLASQTFPVRIHVYGYNYTADAVSLYSENGTPAIQAAFASLASRVENAPAAGTEPVWTWVGEGEKPILCDNLADDFYITWPEGTDASALKDSDVSIRLYNGRGDEKLLTAGKDFEINSSKGETQIAVLYQNWAFIPVYTTMSIEVNGANAKAKTAFDIGSVYVYEAQQGGGGTTIDGTVTAYSFYGLANLTDWKQLFTPAIYLLTCDVDGTAMYYAEDASGAGVLTEDITQAKQFDASGEEDRNQKLIGNTIYITTRQVMREIVKTVNGQSITFTQSYPGRNTGISAGGSMLNPSSCDKNLEAAPGYVIPWGTTNWITNEKWAWQKGVEEGWTGITVTPYSGKFECTVTAGESQQFEAALDGKAVTGEWRIYGAVKEGTTVTQNGLVTVAADETAAQFAVTITSADGEKGTVTIKVGRPK